MQRSATLPSKPVLSTTEWCVCVCVEKNVNQNSAICVTISERTLLLHHSSSLVQCGSLSRCWQPKNESTYVTDLFHRLKAPSLGLQPKVLCV